MYFRRVELLKCLLGQDCCMATSDIPNQSRSKTCRIFYVYCSKFLRKLRYNKPRQSTKNSCVTASWEPWLPAESRDLASTDPSSPFFVQYLVICFISWNEARRFNQRWSCDSETVSFLQKFTHPQTFTHLQTIQLLLGGTHLAHTFIYPSSSATIGTVLPIT